MPEWLLKCVSSKNLGGSWPLFRFALGCWEDVKYYNSNVPLWAITHFNSFSKLQCNSNAAVSRMGWDGTNFEHCHRQILWFVLPVNLILWCLDGMGYTVGTDYWCCHRSKIVLRPVCFVGQAHYWVFNKQNGSCRQFLLQWTHLFTAEAAERKHWRRCRTPLSDTSSLKKPAFHL